MKLFICAREGDAGGYSGRLRGEIGRQAPTTQFVDRADLADTVLLVIGPRWLRDAPDQQSKLLATGDPVCRLVQAALNDSRKVVPVLVGGASVPEPHELPDALAPLVQVNAWPVSHQGFREDVKALLAGMNKPARGAAREDSATVEVTTPGSLAKWAWEASQYERVRVVVDGIDRALIRMAGQSTKVTVAAGRHEVALQTVSIPKQVRVVQVDARPGETIRLVGSRNWFGKISLDRVP